MRGLVSHFRQVYSEAELPERVVYVLVLGITLTGIVLAYIDPTHVDEGFAAEDGVVEWLTVFGLALGVGVCVFRVIKLHAHRPGLFTLATALLALMLFFVAGEEISWGQRIFGVDTPEWFKVHNLQQETNIHNLTIHGKEIRQPIFTYGLGGAMILYLLVITPLYGRAPALARFLDMFAVPVAKQHHVYSYFLLLFVVEELVQSSRRGEILEFGVVYLFLINISFPQNRHAFSVARGSRSADR